MPGVGYGGGFARATNAIAHDFFRSPAPLFESRSALRSDGDAAEFGDDLR